MYPHLKSALILRRKFIDLRLKDSFLDAALNASTEGIVILDKTCRVLFMNRTAEDMVRGGEGLTVRSGRLCAVDLKDSMGLLDLIHSVTATTGAKGTTAARAMFISRRKRCPLKLTVAPFLTQAATSPCSAAAIAFISDHEQTNQDREMFLRRYGLTPAESRLALLLSEGRSLKEAADHCGVTYNTVRSQLKSIFSKTGVDRQAELVQVLLRGSTTA